MFASNESNGSLDSTLKKIVSSQGLFLLQIYANLVLKTGSYFSPKTNAPSRQIISKNRKSIQIIVKLPPIQNKLHNLLCFPSLFVLKDVIEIDGHLP